MSNSKALSAQGLTVYIGSGDAVSVPPGSDTFTEVKEVNDVTPPSPSRNTIDVSHLKSTIKEFIGGLIDGGTGSLTCNNIFDDAGQIACRTALTSGQLRNFRF